ncbi:hypothetical protein [Glycomyces sp. NRRL B-16210]|uniref:hypothetical protein n=1 Tax=Glycomyces sp. NRRL B-16210 TaxID=1463821 RepID=UPI0004C07EB7|nr:hypothetical protein [Glycomyces sp. NRRL B-16210]
MSRLVKEGHFIVEGEGNERRWRSVADGETSSDEDIVTESSDAEASEQDGSEALQERSEAETGDDESDSDEGADDQDASEDTASESEADSDSEDHDEEGEDEEASAEVPALPVVPLPDPDPQILHIARTLADIGEPVDAQTLCDRAYLPSKRRLVTNILRALAEHELVTCSRPFAPDADDAIWELVYDGDLMDAAVRVQLADAPDRMTCDVCGQTKTFGGAPRPRTAGIGVRNDGRTYLAPGELTGFVIDWVTDPQNAGEEFTVRMITKELVAAHPGKVSDNSDGAIKNALDKMLRPDHRRLRFNDRALVALVREVGPRTYRALGL